MDVSVDGTRKKLIDAAGAGTSFTSPGWLTELGRLWGGKAVSFCIYAQISYCDCLSAAQSANLQSVAKQRSKR